MADLGKNSSAAEAVSSLVAMARPDEILRVAKGLQDVAAVLAANWEDENNRRAESAARPRTEVVQKEVERTLLTELSARLHPESGKWAKYVSPVYFSKAGVGQAVRIEVKGASTLFGVATTLATASNALSIELIKGIQCRTASDVPLALAEVQATLINFFALYQEDSEEVSSSVSFPDLRTSRSEGTITSSLSLRTPDPYSRGCETGDGGGSYEASGSAAPQAQVTDTTPPVDTGGDVFQTAPEPGEPSLPKERVQVEDPNQ